MPLHATASRWLDRSGFLLLAALIVLPAWMIPRFSHEAVKIGTEYHVVVVAWALVVVLGTARALEGRSVAAGGEGSWFRRFMIAFGAWVAASALWAEQPAVHLAYAASVFALLGAGQVLVGWVEADPRRRDYVFALLAALLASEVVIGLAQHFQLLSKDLFKLTWPGSYVDGWLTSVGARGGKGQVYGTIGNPNYYAELLVVLLAATAGWAASRPTEKARVALAITLFGGLLVLLYASTRSAVLGLVVGAFVAIAISGAWRSIDLRAWWGAPRGRAAMIVGGIALAAIVAVAGGNLVTKVGSAFESDFSVESRLVNWRAAMGLWSIKPIQGHGLGGWKRESVDILATQNPEGLPASSSNSRFFQVHNEPLQALTELGLIGSGLLLAGFLAWCREVTRNDALPTAQRVGLVAAAVGVLVAAGFGFPFHIPMTALAIVVVLALGVARDRAPGPEALEEPWRWAYALTAFVVLGSVAKTLVEVGVAPALTASQYAFFAQETLRKDRTGKGADVLLAYASEIDRFKAQHVLLALQTLGTQKRYQEVVDLYAKHGNDGLAMSARLLHARALAELGRKDDAIKDYQAVAHYYHCSTKAYVQAYRELGKLGVDIPEPIAASERTSIGKPGSGRPDDLAPAADADDDAPGGREGPSEKGEDDLGR